MKIILEIELGSAEMKTYRDVRASIERGLLQDSEAFDTYVEVGDGRELLDVQGAVVGSWAAVDQCDRPEQVLVGLVRNANTDVLYQLSNKLCVDLGLGNIPEATLPERRGRDAVLVGWANEFNLLHKNRVWHLDYSDAISDFYRAKTKDLRTTKAALELAPAGRLIWEVAKANDACELLESATQHIEHYRDTEELDSLDSADECIRQAIGVFAPFGTVPHPVAPC